MTEPKWDPHWERLAEEALRDEPESGAKRERVAWLARWIAQAVADWLEDNPPLEEELTN